MDKITLKHIRETLETIQANNQLSDEAANDILYNSEADKFAKHKASTISARCTDNHNLLLALTQLIAQSYP